jgi:quaternary ammonium compound-resistance protein SugE
VAEWSIAPVLKTGNGQPFVSSNLTASANASNMAWIALLAAGILEVVWAFTMKQSEGFTRLVPSAITLVAALGSFVLLAFSMKTLPLGTTYVIWTGIGAVGAFVAGILFLGEHANPSRILAAVLIVCGLVLMKVSSPD